MSESEPIEIKIAYIGGGSRYWARMVMTDLALCPHLTGEIALYDIHYEAALRNVAHAKEIYGHPDAQTTFEVNAYRTSEEAFADADFVFDLRCLPNPYWNAELRSLSGLDRPVAEFLDAEPAFLQMFADILAFLERWIPEYQSVNRSYLTVACGCTGGQHRSVSFR